VSKENENAYFYTSDRPGWQPGDLFRSLGFGEGAGQRALEAGVQSAGRSIFSDAAENYTGAAVGRVTDKIGPYVLGAAAIVALAVVASRSR